MGHYYADMMCDDCGKVRCICPPPEREPNNNFMVDFDYTIVTVDEFRERHGFLTLITRPQFKKRSEAELHARTSCEAAVEHARKNLLELKNILKVKRPWEKK